MKKYTKGIKSRINEAKQISYLKREWGQSLLQNRIRKSDKKKIIRTVSETSWTLSNAPTVTL